MESEKQRLVWNGHHEGVPPSLGYRIIFVQAFPVVGDSELIGYLLSSTPRLRVTLGRGLWDGLVPDVLTL